MTLQNKKKTIVGEIDPEVLAYTAGRDVELDQALVEADCLGSAAHVVMLSRMPLKPRLFTKTEVAKIIKELASIMVQARHDRFKITLKDQDVHLAVERVLTRKLGALGKKIHTGRSRNDQVALDLRLYAKAQLLATMGEAADVIDALLRLAKKNVTVPMVGRTHMQPAMPSSVALWASAYVEGLLDDVVLLMNVYELNDQSPLGSAAGYGVALPIDRNLVAELLGFSGVCHNVLYAGNARGKVESIILSALSQVMLTLSRLAQDLMLYTMPEFGYFALPSEYGTGSSIMPQKNNPDVLELARAKATRVHHHAVCVYDILNGLPSGYNRDLQETKEPFIQGFEITRSTLRIFHKLMKGLTVNKKALFVGFTPDLFATDRAVELVAEGVPFRGAYAHVKKELVRLTQADPVRAIAAKKHVGGTAGLDLARYQTRVKEARMFAREEIRAFDKAIAKLLGSAKS